MRTIVPEPAFFSNYVRSFFTQEMNVSEVVVGTAFVEAPDHGMQTPFFFFFLSGKMDQQ